MMIGQKGCKEGRERCRSSLDEDRGHQDDQDDQVQNNAKVSSPHFWQRPFFSEAFSCSCQPNKYQLTRTVTSKFPALFFSRDTRRSSAVVSLWLGCIPPQIYISVSQIRIGFSEGINLREAKLIGLSQFLFSNCRWIHVCWSWPFQRKPRKNPVKIQISTLYSSFR